MELTMLLSVFMDQLGDFHIVAAVFRDLRQLPFLEPADRLQPFRGLFNAESRRGVITR